MTTPKPSDPSKPTAEGKTVNVKTVRYHTIEGTAHNVGEEYEAEAEAVANLVASGFVVRSVEVTTPGAPTPPAPPTAEPKA